MTTTLAVLLLACAVIGLCVHAVAPMRTWVLVSVAALAGAVWIATFLRLVQ